MSSGLRYSSYNRKYEIVKVSIMVNNIEQALQPISVGAFILGFGILRYPVNTPRVRLSIFYMLILWSVYICVLRYVITYFSPRSIFNGILDVFTIITNVLVMVISMIITYRKYKKFRICIKKLGFVDNTLEMLGTPKEYHKMRNSVKWIFITWFIIVCITWIIDSLWLIKKYNNIIAMFIPIIKDYPLHVNTLVDITYMFLLSYIGRRLDIINNHIKELSEIEEYGLRCTWKKPLAVTQFYVRGAENRKRVLWITMHLHSELCRITSDIHSLFEIHMTLQMLSYFVVLIAILHFEYRTMLCLKQMYGSDSIRLRLLLCTHIWLTICVMKLVSFNHICESVSAKAKKTKDIIHKLTNHIYFTEAREEIFQFVLQISLRPLKFSGLGLYHFGYQFIRKFSISILTAVVFILQMNTSPISRMISSKNMTCYD